jgi:hypothetical protein
MKKITKTQILTIVSLILYSVWELHVSEWAKTEAGPIIRVDLIIIFPILIVLIILSIRQLLTRKK